MIVALVRLGESAPVNLLPNAPFTGARDKLLGFQNQMPAHSQRVHLPALREGQAPRGKD